MFYYGPQEKVWSTWNDSDLRQWLVDHGVIKSDAKVAREKMMKMVGYVFRTVSVSLH